MNTGIVLFLAIVGIAFFIWYLKKDRKKAIEQHAKMEEEERAEKRRKDEESRKILEDAERMLALCELMSQAKAVGDTMTYEKVKNNTYNGKLPTRPAGEWLSMYDDLMILKIAGINYRGNLSAYVGWFKGVLKPEPKNDYDPNAIMVKCEDGKHVGYVPEDTTEDVRAFIGADGVDFSPYRVNGQIEEVEDFDEERKFFVGRVFVVRKK